MKCRKKYLVKILLLASEYTGKVVSSLLACLFERGRTCLVTVLLAGFYECNNKKSGEHLARWPVWNMQSSRARKERRPVRKGVCVKNILASKNPNLRSCSCILYTEVGDCFSGSRYVDSWRIKCPRKNERGPSVMGIWNKLIKGKYCNVLILFLSLLPSLSFLLSLSLSVCLSLSVFLSVSVSMSLSFCLSVCLSLSLCFVAACT